MASDLASSGFNVSLNDSNVYIVPAEDGGGGLSGVLGAAGNSNGTSVVGLPGGSFSLGGAQELSGNIILSGGLGSPKRRHLTIDTSSYTVIEAAPNQRHLVGYCIACSS